MVLFGIPKPVHRKNAPITEYSPACVLAAPVAGAVYIVCEEQVGVSLQSPGLELLVGHHSLQLYKCWVTYAFPFLQV